MDALLTDLFSRLTNFAGLSQFCTGPFPLPHLCCLSKLGKYMVKSVCARVLMFVCGVLILEECPSARKL